MQLYHTFDTHAFIKSFINAKTDEEKAEILAKTIVEVKDEANNKVEMKFEKAKDDLVTKLYLDNKIKEIDVKLKETQIKMYVAVGGLGVFLTTVMLGILPFILRH